METIYLINELAVALSLVFYRPKSPIPSSSSWDWRQVSDKTSAALSACLFAAQLLIANECPFEHKLGELGDLEPKREF